MIENGGGLVLAVRLTPNASRDSIDSCEHNPEGLLIKARVRAVPEKGKANTALIKLISKWLKIPKSDIDLQSGSKSRTKLLAIAGEPSELETKLYDAIQALEK